LPTILKSFQFYTILKGNFCRTDRSVDKDHGRIEIRECWTLPAALYQPGIRNLDDWAKVTTLILIRRKRRLKDKTEVNICYFISSLQTDAKRFLEIIHSQWGIENNEILNYFVARETSGFVEGFNNKIKVLERRCNGITKVVHLFQPFISIWKVIGFLPDHHFWPFHGNSQRALVYAEIVQVDGVNCNSKKRAEQLRTPFDTHLWLTLSLLFFRFVS
jgi:predicted transposase YbfD/YdcC